MEENKIIINIENLHKKFGKKRVLNGVDIKVREGEVYGVFGKNGAGKSTLFKLILGLIVPTEGEILIDGKKVGKARNISVGYLPENVSIYSYLSVENNIKVAALSAGVEINKKEISSALEKVNLAGSNHVLGRDLSLGMKRRLQFAMATMTKPVDILILDEPTNGMDVNGILWLRAYLKELKKRNTTILMCSHSLNVMESVIDKYCIFKDGKIVKENEWKEEKTKVFEIYFCGKCENKEIKKLKEVGAIMQIRNDKVIIESDKSILDISQFVKENNIRAIDIERKRYSLEDIFIESVKEHE